MFEKANFSVSDGSIENLLNPLNSWRLPTGTELDSILNGPRDGSTVNGVSGARWANISLTDADFPEYVTPTGILLFPDGATITGKTLVKVNEIYEMENDGKTEHFYCTTGVTASELNEYLSQGCSFLPRSATYFEDDWFGISESDTYWFVTSTGFFSIDTYEIQINDYDGEDENEDDSKRLYYYHARLVKPVN